MHIAYISNAKWPHCTEVHISRSLQGLGHTVINLQEDAIDYENLLAYSKTVDFFLYGRTWNIKGTPEQREKFFKEKKVPMIGFHLDIWWGLDRQIEIGEHPFFRCDAIFTADGGHQENFERIGIKNFYLPPGVFDKECYLAEPREEFRQEIIFVGSHRWYHKCHPFRQELIKWLQENYGERFTLYPNNEWPCVRGDDLNALYSSVKIVIGDSLDSPMYVSDRIPETLGRGGFLLHPINKAIDEMELKTGEHLITYTRGNWKELKYKINYWLDKDADREKIKKQGHEFVKKNHTYKKRMEILIKTLKDEGYVDKN